MPSNYAHYRFGGLVLNTLDPEMRSPIQRFRRIFDVGLHGPDLLFYYNPFWNNASGQLGSRLHQKTGREFFTAACTVLKENPSETGAIYLFGLLGHYCLDSLCRPYIHEKSNDRQVRHAELETDFDRYLLRLDGKIPPHLQCINEHMHLTQGECVTVSQFLSPATPSQIRSSIRNMRLHTKLLAHKKRALLEAILKLTNKNVQDHVMMAKPNPRCEKHNPELITLYNSALARYPSMLQQLVSHINDGTPLGEDFDPIFG
jgi:hypothetical protein